jgi:uncharacterized membrane protein
MNVPKNNVSLSRFETAISYLLRVGVITSLILEVIGIGFLYNSLGSFNICCDPEVYITGRDFFTFVFEQFQTGQVTDIGIFFITAGIIVLILTPFLRVIASVIYFVWQRNSKYTLITLIVLIAVTLSLILH